MELGSCPHCSDTVRSLNDTIFCCKGCYSEVKLTCSKPECNQDVQLKKGKLPNFCSECGDPVNLSSVKRTAFELRCHGCSDSIPRRQLQLPKYCSNCKIAIDADQLQRVTLEFTSKSASDAADVVGIDDVQPGREMMGPTSSPTANEIMDSGVFQKSGTNQPHLLTGPSRTTPIVSTEVVPMPAVPPDDSSSSSTNLPLVMNAAVNSAVGVASPICAEAIETNQDDATYALNEAELEPKPQREDKPGPLEPAAMIAAGRGQQLQSSPEQRIVTSTVVSAARAVHGNYNVSDDTAITGRLVGNAGDKQDQTYAFLAPTNRQSLRQEDPPGDLRLDQTRLLSRRADDSTGRNEAVLPQHESLAISRHGVNYIKLETLPSMEWGRSATTHSVQAKNTNIVDNNMQGGDGNNDNPSSIQVDQPSNAAYTGAAHLADLRFGRNYNLNSEAHGLMVYGEPRINVSDYGDSADSDEYMDAETELRPEHMGVRATNAVVKVDYKKKRLPRSNAARSRFLKRPVYQQMDESYPDHYDMIEPPELPVNPMNMTKRDFIDVTFYVTISQSFNFDKKFDWPMIEFYGFGPEDKPFQRPLSEQCLPSGRSGWMVAIRLPWQLLNGEQPLRYKYLVQHGTSSGLDDTYEWIHKNKESEDCLKRELRLPRDAEYKDQWAQYDLIMMPQEYVEIEFPPANKTVQNLLARESEKRNRIGVLAMRPMLPGTIDRTTPVDANKRRLYESITADAVVGLESMLPDFMFCVANGNMKGAEVIESFCGVVKCIRNGRIYFLDESLHTTDEIVLQRAIALQLVERARQQGRLMQLANDQPVTGDQLSQLMRIVSGLVLVSLANRWRSDEVYEHAATILSSFNTTGLTRIAIEECLRYHFASFKYVASSLQSFMMEAARSGDAEWLWAVPLYHILQGRTKYDRRSCKYRAPHWWGLDRGLQDCMQAFKAQARKFKIRDWFPSIRTMADQSWISERTFIAALSKDQLLTALDQQLPLPLDGYIAAVLRHCQGPHEFTSKEGAAAFDDLSKILLSAQRSNADVSQPLPFEQIMNSLEIVNDFMFDIVQHNVIIFKSWDYIRRVSQLVSGLGLSPKEGTSAHVAELIANFRSKVGDWLLQTLSFPLADPGEATFKEDSELEMWETLFGLTWHLQDTQDAWVSMLSAMLQSRLDKADGYAKVAIYCMTGFGSPHVENIFGAAALQAADGVMRSSSQDIDYKRSAKTLEKYGKIFSSAFNKAWEQQSENDSEKLKFMLTWPRFSTYVSLACSEHSMALEQSCTDRIGECVRLLTTCCKQLIDGSMTYLEFDFLLKHSRSFILICQQLYEIQWMDECARGINKWLDTRQKEKSDFDQMHADLRMFVMLCERLEKVQLMDLPKKLEEELSMKPLSQLWVPAQTPTYTGVIECRQFPYTKTLLTPELLVQVRKVSASKLFASYWAATGNMYLKQRAEANPIDGSSLIELKEVVAVIWKNAFYRYNDFVNRLGQGIATFSDAEFLLVACERSEKHVNIEVQHLMDGLSNMKEVNKRVKQYSALCHYRQGAEVMRKLKDRFSLTGDFSDLEVLINWKQDQSRKLQDITDKMISAGEKLKAMDEPKKLACLEAFVDCKPLIDWVKENVNESKELKVFVDLASIVAGEGDIEVEKVSCLHAAVTGYAPLIYELPQTADLSTFLVKCEAVWKSLDTNKNLTKQLRDTASNIEWVKSVKDAYGAVEFTSLAQATALNEKGTFEVGSLSHEEVKIGYQGNVLDSVVRAKVPGIAKQLSDDKAPTGEKKYTYGELSELQSKLMLVAGKAEQDNPEVEKFVNIFRNITRLANAYVKAGDVGTVLFESWRAEFICDKEKSDANLRVFFGNSDPALQCSNDVSCADHASDLADFLENCVHEWTAYMQSQRENHPELNYFTTQQIVFLRKELGHCLESGRVNKGANYSKKVCPILAMLLPCNWLDIEQALSNIPVVTEESPRRPRRDSSSSHLVPPEGEHDTGSSSDVIRRLKKKWQEFLESASTDADDSLSVEHLGYVLRYLADKKATRRVRHTPPGLARGQPHLIVCPDDQVLFAALSIYMADADCPPPTRNEVLVCTEQTSLEEVELLLQRAVSDEQSIYCLVHAQRLSYDMCGHVEKRIEDFQNKKRQYFIAVICAEENEDRSRMITALDRFRVRSFHVQHKKELRNYVKKHLEVPESSESAALGCEDRSCVRLVCSRRAGVGKTLHIRRLMETLKRNVRTSVPAICVQLVQQDVNLNALLHKLLDKSCEPANHKCRIIHINIAQEVLHGVDELLFNLLILGSICQQEGFVWQRSIMDYYAIETVPLKKKVKVNNTEIWQTVHSVLDILPARDCFSPKECLQYYQNNCSNIPGHGPVLSDEGKANTNPDLPDLEDANSSPVLMDVEEAKSESWQRTYHYLKNLKAKKILSPYEHEPGARDLQESAMLSILLEYCKLSDPSWAELRHFVDFLNVQLRDCEMSAFCSTAAREDLPGFLEFVVKFMLRMSQDFATRSLKISEESPEAQLAELQQHKGDGYISAMEITHRWENSPHPYIFFNRDHNSLTFLGFFIERRNGNILVPRTARVLEEKAVTKNLFDGLERNNVDLSEDFESKSRDEKIQKICSVMGNYNSQDPDKTYELTLDNVKKILAIQMRFRCGIPVIIMGETGCGKTRLVKYMCDLQVPKGEKINNLVLMKIHGGTTAEHVKRKVHEALKLANENKQKFSHVDTVLFLDEANTTDAIGLIKEVMCDGSLDGVQLNDIHGYDVGLRIVAAVNPYRKHSPKMIEQLERAGLGYNVKADDTSDRLGSIPMRHLVYRVRALPLSMLPLVWDFGRLSSDVEEKYINQMISKYADNGKKVGDSAERAAESVERQVVPASKEKEQSKDLFANNIHREAIAKVLVKCQEFMRGLKDECSFVSLRDIDRVLKVMSWFLEKETLFREQPPPARTEASSSDDHSLSTDSMKPDHSLLPDLAEPAVSSTETPDLPGQARLSPMTWSLVLALGVCYHACLQPRKRSDFRRIIASHFRHPLVLPSGDRRMLEEIDKCQQQIITVLSKSGHIDKNIAHNHALKENIFMMVICMELRIPLFLVGKPGSSKSLAKTIVADAMQGDAAKSHLFKNLKQVHLVSFQCSPLATPEGIIGTFKQCARFQKSRNLEKFVSVVVLDEVGLAEDSKLMPLKTLHPLLEEGCDGDDKPEAHMKCAFIGISNWALDPAKMNRGIVVQRGVPEKKELEESAKGICKFDVGIDSTITPCVGQLAAAYLRIFDEAGKHREFFGLRDFYSLMKMVGYFASQRNALPTPYQFRHAILRNFGGYENNDVIKIFERLLSKYVSIDEKQEPKPGDPPCDAIGLIDTSLTGKFTRAGGESRYLLILTENDTALSFIQSKLQVSRPEIIFGSNFPKDLEYTQVCRNINRIKVCMETGTTVILLNLENLYESLYDALNQYYVYLGGKRFVDLGLGTHRVKCRVHEDFRLIVIADKEVVHKKFPIPLINRLEKHYVRMTSLLTNNQQEIVVKIRRWATEFVQVQMPQKTLSDADRCNSLEDAFIGYSDDAVAALVLQVIEGRQKPHERIPDARIQETAKLALLLSATPDAVLRVRQSALRSQYDNIFSCYYHEQQHDNLGALLHARIVAERPADDLFLQVTTHYKLLSREDVNLVTRQLSPSINRDNIRVIYALQALDTEQQFSREIRDFYTTSKDPEIDRLLIVQCEAGHENVKLISCARYIIWREYNSIAVSSHGQRGRCHVVLVVQLPQRARFRGFHGGRWVCIHVDDLHPQKRSLPTIDQMKDKTISEVLGAGLLVLPVKPGSDTAARHGEAPNLNLDEPELTESADTQSTLKGNRASEQSFDTYELLRNCVREAASRLYDSSGMPNRSIQRLGLLVSLFSMEGNKRFQELFCGSLIRLMQRHEAERMSREMSLRWLNFDAAAKQNVFKFGTFRKSLENCLERKIAPLFAVILAFMDTNCNLDLLTSAAYDGWLGRLWLNIFSGIDYESSDMSLTFANIVSPEQRCEVPIICKSAYGTAFTPKFPFSWLLKELLDAMIVQAKNRPDISQLLDNMLTKDKAFGCIMTKLTDPQQKDATERYLHDFVYLSCRFKMDNSGLHQILATSIKCVMQSKKMTTIPGVHICFTEIEPRLLRLLRIVELEPSLVQKVSEELQANKLRVEGELEMVGDVVGLHFLLLTLEPFGEPSVWCAKIRKCYMLVEEILNAREVCLEGSKCASILQECRQRWARLLVSLIFTEHTEQWKIFSMKEVQRFFHFLALESDFKKAEALQGLEYFLGYCNNLVITSIYGEHIIKRLCYAGGREHTVTNPVLLPCRHVMCSSCLQNLFGATNQGIECFECSKFIPFGYTYSPDDPRERESIEQHRKYKQHFSAFFSQILMELVFAGPQPPEEAAMKRVLTYVTIGQDGSGGPATSLHTKQLSPFIDVTLIDPTPVIRSLILQLLLRASEGFVNKHVSEYFEKTVDITKNIGGPAVTEFCVLFISCLEDYNIEKLNKASSRTMLSVSSEACNYVENAMRPQGPAWRLFEGSIQLDANALHAIAALRLSLVIGADVICKYMINTPGHATAREASNISRALSEMCDHAERGSCSWPRRFLAKQMIRKYGATSFHSALSIPSLRYILPKEFDNTEDAAPLSDLFVVASNVKMYAGLRRALSNSIVDGHMDAFLSFVSASTESKPIKDMYSVLAICALFIRNYRGCDSEIYVKNEAKSMIEQFAAHQWPAAKDLCAGVVMNSFPEKLAISRHSQVSDVMVVMLIYRIVSGLLIRGSGGSTLLSPLLAIILEPASMQKAFFPTMPHDPFLEIREVVKRMSTDTENLLPYACPNGHIYYIGNCGRAYALSKCPECGSVIGGTGHIVADGNREVKLSEDHTKPGHILGSAASGTSKKQAQGERDLSPLSCIALRAVLHMTLYASIAINGKDKVADLVRPKPENLAEFLWAHVMHDIGCLQTVLNKSFDDSMIFLHTITARLIDSAEQVGLSWSSQDGRRKWENTVQATVLLPAIQTLQTVIDEGASELKSDSGSSSTALALAGLLEEVEITASNPNVGESLPLLSSAALWRYRESPSVEHFVVQFENHCNMQASTASDSGSSGQLSHAALQKFLHCREQLAAIRFLPDALALIMALPREYGRKIDIASAKKLTIRLFLESTSRPPHEYSQLVNSFIEAWNTVRAHVPGHTFWCQGQRLQAPAELCANPMSLDSPLRMLLASIRGTGLCSLALITYLAKLQNEFLDLYTQTYRKGLEQDVPLLSLGQVHLIAFDANVDLLPIILANCEYSLKPGEGALVRYDFDNIQRRIMDRFVRHKPPIMLACDGDGVDGIPLFLYREDLANGNQFDKLTRMLPQEALMPELKDAIRREYHGSISELSDALVVIDQAVGFLVTSRTADVSRQLLMSYLQTVLHMPDIKLSFTLHECCYLHHVRAVWLLLSLQRAKALATNQHECFEGVDATYCQPIGGKEAAAAKQLSGVSKKRLELAEKVSEILYELIVLKLANRRREPAPDSDAEEDFSFQPTYPLFPTLNEYAKQTYGKGCAVSMSESAAETLFACLDELSADYQALQLQHSTAVWYLVSRF